MSRSPAETKTELRRSIRAALLRLTPAERASASAALCARVREHPAWRLAETVLLFMPLADEPDLRPLLADALAGGKTLALPRHRPTDDRYEACRVTDLAAELRRGAHGVSEPGPDCAALPLNRLDLVLVPGVAFSPVGGRLGRGKGYYDRLLAAVPGCKMGVGFDCQLVIELPEEPHDVRLNWILTPSSRHEIASRARL